MECINMLKQRVGANSKNTYCKNEQHRDFMTLCVHLNEI